MLKIILKKYIYDEIFQIFLVVFFYVFFQIYSASFYRLPPLVLTRRVQTNLCFFAIVTTFVLDRFCMLNSYIHWENVPKLQNFVFIVHFRLSTVFSPRSQKRWGHLKDNRSLYPNVFKLFCLNSHNFQSSQGIQGMIFFSYCFFNIAVSSENLKIDFFYSTIYNHDFFFYMKKKFNSDNCMHIKKNT